LPPLPLAPETAAPQPGDRLLHIGYPSDLGNLLFRVDSAERVEIRRTAGDSHERLLAELARRRLIQPVVTEGTVTAETDSALVHNAGARLGGTGGPLIDERQRVVGLAHASGTVGSSDQGVPIRYAWDIVPSRIARALGRRP
jgi:hypothetical protein